MFTLTWMKPQESEKNQPPPYLFVPKGDRFTFGRSADCDRQIEAQGLSRLHCTLVKADGEWVLVDGDGVEGSRHGIFYGNGERVSVVKMLPGQAIVLIGSKFDEVVLMRDRLPRTADIEPGELTASYELSPRVLVDSLTDQTGQIESKVKDLMSQDRSYRDDQMKEFLDLLNIVCDETKRLRTDFSISTVDDGNRDKKMTELRTLTRVLAVIVGGAGLWLLVKDQQTASNIFGIVIMIGGAVGFGRSGKN